MKEKLRLIEGFGAATFATAFQHAMPVMEPMLQRISNVMLCNPFLWAAGLINLLFLNNN